LLNINVDRKPNPAMKMKPNYPVQQSRGPRGGSSKPQKLSLAPLAPLAVPQNLPKNPYSLVGEATKKRSKKNNSISN